MIPTDCPFSKQIVDRACKILDMTVKKNQEYGQISNHWSIIEDCLYIVKKAKIEGYPKLKRSKEACKGRKYLLQEIIPEHFDKMEEIINKGEDISLMRMQYRKSGKVCPIAVEGKQITFDARRQVPISKKNRQNLPRQIQSPVQQALSFLLRLISPYSYQPKKLPIPSVYQDIIIAAKQLNFSLQLFSSDLIQSNSYDQLTRIKRFNAFKNCLPSLIRYLLSHPSENPNNLAMFGIDENSFYIWNSENTKDEKIPQQEKDLDIQERNAQKTKKAKDMYLIPSRLEEFDKIWKDFGIGIDQVILKTEKIGYNWSKIYTSEQYRALWYLTFAKDKGRKSPKKPI